MPWRKTDPVTERKRFVEDWQAGNTSDLAVRSHRYTISRETVPSRFDGFWMPAIRAILDGKTGTPSRSIKRTPAIAVDSRDHQQQSLASCRSQSSVPFTAERLSHKALSRSYRRDHPKNSGRLRPRGFIRTIQ